MSSETSAEFTRTWRYKVGLSMIVIGHIALIAGLLMPVLGLGPGGKAGLAGVLIIGGEVVALASIVFLGKDGFKAIKAKMVGAVKASYTGPVGRGRHYLGIVLLLTHVATTYIIALYAWDSFGAATAGGPHPEVWGLGLNEQASLVGWLFLAGEICFLLALYVLGAGWWERFRGIFVWQES